MASMATASTSRVGRMAFRSCSTSSAARMPLPRTQRGQLGDFNVRDLQRYQLDEATSLGYMRLERIREAQELVKKSEDHREVLAAQRKRFTPPSRNAIRMTTTIDLSEPDSPRHAKQVLLAPVGGLPLKGPEALHRLKLLAGPRWTPGRPGRDEADVGNEKYDEHKEGWIKISEERFKSARMNRKSASDMLERLVEAANDPDSPLPASTPLDLRHVLARQRKDPARQLHRRADGLHRKEVVGGVKGFPKHWVVTPTPDGPVPEKSS